MFVEQNKIIIVDDDQGDLDRMSSQFHARGIGCKALLYNVNHNQAYNGVRIAFFDININPGGGGSQNQRLTSLANAIQQYIALDNGPFALIFWTSNADLIDNFKAFVQQRYQNQNIDFPKPFFVNFIDKHEFLDGAGGDLGQKLSQLLSSPILKALFDFENVSGAAAAKAIDEVYKIIPHGNDTWGTTTAFNGNFEAIFSRVAAHTLGLGHAKGNPDRAVYEALVPIQNHFIYKEELGNSWEQILTTLQAAQGYIKVPEGFKESILNGVFHIDAAGDTKDARGIVLEIKKHKKIIDRFFNGKYDDWVKSVLPLKNKWAGNQQQAREEEVKKFIKNTTVIAIEISSACDHSQNKSRLNKYLLGIKTTKIPEAIRVNHMPSESARRVGEFYYENEEFEIFVNLTYVFGAHTSDKHLGKPLFIFRKEIMDQIGNRYANHISRIGITSF
jgi:hypothetical protein